MPPPADETDAQRQYRLVRKAILLFETNPCFEYEDGVANRVRSRCAGLEPSAVRRMAAEFVRGGGQLRQRRETDEEWLGRRNFDYWYSVCFEVPDIDEPVFVKIVLLSDDEDFPEARIVGAHLSVS
jgi:hypothetical protein